MVAKHGEIIFLKRAYNFTHILVTFAFLELESHIRTADESESSSITLR